MYYIKVVCLVSFTLLFSIKVGKAQTFIFSTNPFSSSPEASSWLGDAAHFKPFADTSWQLRATTAGKTSLLHPIPTKVDEISTTFTLDFAPSNANNLQLILASDRADLAKNWNGYLLQFGENGSADQPELFAVKEGKRAESVHRFAFDIATGGTFTVTLEKQDPENGYWHASFSDESTLQATVHSTFNWLLNNEYIFTHFGYQLNYTQSNTEAFLLHDLQLGYQTPMLTSFSENPIGVELFFSHAINTLFNPQFLLENEPVSFSWNKVYSLFIPWPADEPIGSKKVHLKDVVLLGSGAVSDTLIHVERPYIPKAGDLAITEFLAISDSQNPEFVEFYNASNFPILVENLSLADLRDTLNFATLPNSPQSIPPKSYAVIGHNLADFYQLPSSAIYINSPIPTLNNGGDRIALIFNKNTVLDDFSYSSSWVRPAESTERRRIDLPSTWQLNWEVANQTDAMSPGFANSVFLDENPPSLLDFKWNPPSTLNLMFDEPIHSSSPIEIVLFQNEPQPVSYQLIESPSSSTTLALELLTDLPKNVHFELKIDGIADFFGNRLTNVFVPLFIKETEIPAFGDIRINEFLADGPVEIGEFIELQNVSSKIIDVQNLSITDASRQRFRFSLGKNELQSLLKPSAYIAVGNFMPLLNVENYHVQSSFLSLNNTNETLQLWYADSVLLDEVRWNKLPAINSQLGAQATVSMEKTDPSSSGLDISKWKRTQHINGHTVGIQNDQFYLDESPPEMLYAQVKNDSLIITFNEFSVPPNQSSFWADGVMVSTTEIKPLVEKFLHQWVLPLKLLAVEKIKEVELINWTDLNGNRLNVGRVAVSHQPNVGEVIINEIFYQPIQDDEDGIPNQFEWIELHNRSTHHLDINKVLLHQGVTERGFKNRISLTSDHPLIIAPGGYFLISAEENSTPYFNADEATFYVGKRSLSLSNDSANVYLFGKDENSIDSVKYHHKWHHPALQIQQGISLERIHPAESGFNPQNWGSNTLEEGHSKGFKNSLTPIFDESDPTQITKNDSNTLIHIEPQIFSPNGDGNDEVCEIQLLSSSKTEIVTAQIFDRTGIPIKKLTANSRIGANKRLFWNGRSDNNIPVESGVYILWVEWKDFETNKAFSLKKRLIIAPYK